MNPISRHAPVFAALATLALGACSPMNGEPYPANPNVAGARNAYPVLGVVQSIEPVRSRDNGVGLGTVAGALVGGVLGNQVGAGRGNAVATVAGVAGGAYVGHELETRQENTISEYRITVRMDDGSYQGVTQRADRNFRVGDRVRFENGDLQRN